MPSPKMDPVVKVFNSFKTLTIPQMETALALCQAEVKQYHAKSAKLRTAPKNQAKPLSGEPVPAKVS